MISQDSHVVKSGGEQWMDRLRAAGEHEIALPVANRADRLENGNCAASAGGRVAEPRSPQVAVRCDNSAGRVGQQLPPPLHLAGRHQIVPTKPLGNVVAIAHVGADRAAKALAVNGPKV